ncbi:hypothetical protein CEXT_8561 [Caerostris extrusa]|uniref:Uncharacterized protein n=1 Tax=Caerostris extrusa TaxID=172846 RepID=A0AAV4MUV0_CAEEX|nr:hypothetical protein CEXT_8561 [Caerostris extrusa]
MYDIARHGVYYIGQYDTYGIASNARYSMYGISLYHMHGIARNSTHGIAFALYGLRHQDVTLAIAPDRLLTRVSKLNPKSGSQLRK